MGHSNTAGSGYVAVVLAVLACCAVAGAQEPLRLTRSSADPRADITLAGTPTAQWQERDQIALLLKGKVSVRFDTLTVSASEIVSWSTRSSDGTRLECYLENAVVQDGKSKQSVKVVFLDLSTRGSLTLAVTRGTKVPTAAPSNDPFVERGRALRRAAEPSLSAPAAPVSGFSAPADSNVDPALKPVSFTELQPDPEPIPAPPPGTGIQLTQGPAPAVPPGPPPPGSPAPAPGASLAPPQTLPPPTPIGPAPPPGLLGPGLPSGAIHFRYFTIAPRYFTPFHADFFPLPDGRDAVVLTGGIIVTVNGVDQLGTLDMEADRVVVWTRGGLGQQVIQGIQSSAGQSLEDLEFYLAGHVEIREQSLRPTPQGPRPELTTLHASEIYYDANRHVALGFNADVEILTPELLQPLQMHAERLEQLTPTLFHGLNADISASRLPSDPRLRIHVVDATLEERQKQRRGLLGPVIDRATGKPEIVEELITTSRDVMVYADDVPIFYLPYLKGDARNPLGPIENFNFSYNKIFGAQVGVTLNAYTLLGIDPLPDTHWRLDLDYLSARGPSAGTQFEWNTRPTIFDCKAENQGFIHPWYINDKKDDLLGGIRPGDPGELDHPMNRDIVTGAENLWGLPYGFSFQGEINYYSDKNVYEQFFKSDYDSSDQRTYAQIEERVHNFGWTLYTEPQVNTFMTQTEWLPRADAALIGQSTDSLPWNLFTYSGNVDAAYAQLRPYDVPALPHFATIKYNNTSRFDFNNELDMPLKTSLIGLGDLRVVPYATLDYTYYSDDLMGDTDNRLIYGGGVRTSLPFSRLYPCVQSELLNLDGLYHKIELSANFYADHSDVPYTRLPQLDLLFDYPELKALEDIAPLQTTYNPAHATLLNDSPVYDPQLYAIRQLVANSIDSRDTIEEVQLDLRQRLQTKRGYPGEEHTTDFMTLDLSATYFPDSSRDNFGSPWAFLQYDWTWNIGDRTTLTSTGWDDPESGGPKVWTFGMFLNRPDRTNFYLGYRQIDPLNSRAVTGAVTYIFSPKYSMTFSSVYDFGTGQALTNSLVFTRVGSDLQVSLGANYNAILNSWGLVFEVIPNVSSRTRSRYLTVADPRALVQ